MSVCPLKSQGYNPHEGCFSDCACDGEECAWWDSLANFNPETKQFEGQCCILTLSQLKIKGGINSHPY